MRIFHTEYNLNHNSYGSFVVAKNKNQAEIYIKERNIGENLTAVEYDFSWKRFNERFAGLPSNFYKKEKYIECLHGVIFLSWVAASSGKIKSIESINDEGLIHKIMHCLHTEYERNMFIKNNSLTSEDANLLNKGRDIHKKRFIKDIINLEKCVPGFLPSYENSILHF